MSKSIALLVCTLFVLWATFVGSSQASDTDLTLLQDVCARKPGISRSLTRISQLRSLVALLKQPDAVNCPDRIKSSIVDLYSLIDEHKEDVCSQQSADAIVQYYQEYVAKDNKDEAARHGASFERFFISYGLEVSQNCRNAASNLLYSKSQDSELAAAFDEFAEYTGSQGFISIFLDSPTISSNDFVLPKKLIKLISAIGGSSNPDAIGPPQLLLKPSPYIKIKRLQAVCERQFRPVYRELLMPLLSLAEVNFNQVGFFSLARKPEMIKTVYEWYRVVFLCESLGSFEALRLPEEQATDNDGDDQVVSVLDVEEAKQVKEANSAKQTDEPYISDLELVSFTRDPVPWRRDDFVYEDNLLYNDQIEKFKKRTRESRVPKFLRKLMKATKSKLARGSIKIMKGLTGFNSLPANGTLTNLDLVHFIDEYVDASESGDSKAISRIKLLGSTLGVFRGLAVTLSVLGSLLLASVGVKLVKG